MVTLNKILVATDFDEASTEALEYGRAVARAFGATLHVLHITDDAYRLAAASVEGYVGLSPEAQEEIERSAERQTNALLTEGDRWLLNAAAVTITSDRIAPAIVEYARAHNVDLIVVGTHGRRALARLVMGSVAESVVRTAPCPVLTVHHPGHKFVMSEVLAAPRRERPPVEREDMVGQCGVASCCAQ